MIRFDATPYGDIEFPPVEEVLGPQTLRVVSAPDRVGSFLLFAPSFTGRAGLADCTILAEGPGLDAEQIRQLRSLILKPEAHYNGHPIYKRRPSVPNFAFLIRRADCTVEMLVDLTNPGWEFHCGAEHHQNWNWVGPELARLAKALFPEYASPHAGSVWKRGVVEELKRSRGIGPGGRRPDPGR
jgi:hypothetical protein